MPTPSHNGQDLYGLAKTKVGQNYDHTLVPKDNPDWVGPWDCAELASWCVYQLTQKLYGCTNNKAKPALAEAYSGSWYDDVKSGLLTKASLAHAMHVAGTVLIRKPSPGAMGHIAIADGKGGTVEASGAKLGVTDKLKVAGRQWDAFALIPSLAYSDPAMGKSPAHLKPDGWLTLKTTNVSGPTVRALQQALMAKGFHPGAIDGIYGPHTHAAVLAFQAGTGLVVDGWVGPRTRQKLGLDQ
jgi:N-acetylmuramoyl-L-alanine amidase